jgi:dihydroxy-acid dehydratase
VANRTIDVAVPADELSRRNGPGFRVPASGYLDTFRHDVRDMSTGGVLVPPKE